MNIASPLLFFLLLACSAPSEQVNSPSVPIKQSASSYQWKSAPLNPKNKKGAKVKFNDKNSKLSPNVLKNYASIEIHLVYHRSNEEDKLIAKVQRSAESDALVKAFAACQLYQRRYVDLLISTAGCQELHFLDAEGKIIARYRDLIDFLDCFKDAKGNYRSTVAEFEAFMKD